MAASDRGISHKSERKADYDLVQRAVAGDRIAFEEIYWAHHRRVFLLCLKMVKNPATAEDLTQEVFVKFFRKMGTFRGDAKLSTWLYRTAVNETLMLIRSRNAAKDEITETGDLPEDESAGRHGGDLLESLTIKQAVARLPRGYRKIFVLHDVNGFGHDEIASLLGCAAGTSKSQLYKARQKLKALLRTSRPGAAR